MEKKESVYRLTNVVNSAGMQQIVSNNLHKSGAEYVQAFLDLSTRPDDLYAVCLAIFDNFPRDIDPATEIELDKVQEGIQDFLACTLFGRGKLPSIARG